MCFHSPFLLSFSKWLRAALQEDVPWFQGRKRRLGASKQKATGRDWLADGQLETLPLFLRW